MTIQLISDKEWTDFIGTKPEAQYRQISVQLPENVVSDLFVKTTNADVNMQPTIVNNSLLLDVNGGNISFDLLSAGSNIDLTVKNGNISFCSYHSVLRQVSKPQQRNIRTEAASMPLLNLKSMSIS